MDLLEQIGKLVGDYGLPLACGVVVLFILVYILRHVLNTSKEERQKFYEVLEERHAFESNHMHTLSESVIRLTERLDAHNDNLKEGIDRMVDAINYQTQIIINPKDGKVGGE